MVLANTSQSPIAAHSSKRALLVLVTRKNARSPSMQLNHAARRLSSIADSLLLEDSILSRALSFEPLPSRSIRRPARPSIVYARHHVSGETRLEVNLFELAASLARMRFCERAGA